MTSLHELFLLATAGCVLTQALTGHCGPVLSLLSAPPDTRGHIFLQGLKPADHSVSTSEAWRCGTRECRSLFEAQTSAPIGIAHGMLWKALMHSLCHAHTAEYSGTNPPAFNATEIYCKYNYRVIQLLYEWDQGKCGRGSWERIDIKKGGWVRMAEGKNSCGNGWEVRDVRSEGGQLTHLYLGSWRSPSLPNRGALKRK